MVDRLLPNSTSKKLVKLSFVRFVNVHKKSFQTQKNANFLKTFGSGALPGRMLLVTKPSRTLDYWDVSISSNNVFALVANKGFWFLLGCC